MLKKTNCHVGHRERLRLKYISTDETYFNDHEILELLLFYSVPREDTNGTAHLLLERFGSIEGIARAGIDELQEVRGVGERSAMLLKLALSLARRMSKPDIDRGQRVDGVEDMALMARHYTMYSPNELLYASFLDASGRLIDTSLIGCGSVAEVKPVTRVIIEMCMLKHACSVIIFHNHPCGSVSPSDADIAFTRDLARELEMIGARLREHIIVNEREYFAVLNYLDGFGGRTDFESFRVNKLY